MSNKLKWILGALLLSLGGLIGCGGDDSGSPDLFSSISPGPDGVTSTVGSGGSPGTGGVTSTGGSGGAGGSGSPSPCVGPSGWFVQTIGGSQSSSYFISVHFVDAQVGWAVGYAAGDGTIGKTSDGGANWIAQNIGTGPRLYSVHFANAMTGWAAYLLPPQQLRIRDIMLTLG